MKLPLLIIILIVITTVSARADVVIESTTGTTVAFTNSQSNFAWSPSAIIYTRADTVPVSLSIYRHGNGQSILLASISATASNLIWVPQSRYLFATGSSLVLESSVDNFSVQLHREAAHE